MVNMRGALSSCRHVPGWERMFLEAIEHGYSEKNAAGRCGIGTNAVHERLDKDEIFKRKYEETIGKRKNRPAGGF